MSANLDQTKDRPFRVSADQSDPFVNAVSVLLWTAGALGVQFLLGKVIAYAGSGMPYGCWQMTGARAAATTLVVGSLVSMRRGNLALFGAGYAALLMISHASPLLVASAILGGLAAWGMQRVLRDASLLMKVLGATLAFSVVLTMSGLIRSFGVGLHERLGFYSYSSGLGIRVLSTVVVAAIVVLVFTMLTRRSNATASAMKSLQK